MMIMIMLMILTYRPMCRNWDIGLAYFNEMHNVHAPNKIYEECTTKVSYIEGFVTI